MKQNIQIIATIIITFILLFATSLLLDIPLIEKSITRSILIFMLMIIELGFGFLILKEKIS